MLYLSKFNFILKYASGTKMGKAGGLGKKLDQKVRVENNKNKIKKARKMTKQLEMKKVENKDTKGQRVVD